MKLIEAKIAKEFASSFFGDPILKWAVNKVLDNVVPMLLVGADLQIIWLVLMDIVFTEKGR